MTRVSFSQTGPATVVPLTYVVSAPSLGRRWWAARGAGAFCNGAQIHVSPVATLAESHLCYDDVPGFTEVVKNFLLEIGYVGSRSTHLTSGTSANQASLASS